ncbi:hypothetical protein ACH6CV_06600 [Bacillota bacterium Meth-B3]
MHCHNHADELGRRVSAPGDDLPELHCSPEFPGGCAEPMAEQGPLEASARIPPRAVKTFRANPAGDHEVVAVPDLDPADPYATQAPGYPEGAYSHEFSAGGVAPERED